ncbi:MAG: hypothetical protein EOP34_00630 [Rickettsiales bacterium]|nr:MAG: hypothetical protein EOP34_00630 [Rickettsiales bacterium]
MIKAARIIGTGLATTGLTGAGVGIGVVFATIKTYLMSLDSIHIKAQNNKDRLNSVLFIDVVKEFYDNIRSHISKILIARLVFCILALIIYTFNVNIVLLINYFFSTLAMVVLINAIISCFFLGYITKHGVIT